MANQWKGSLDGQWQRHAIIVSAWNDLITKSLLEGAQSALSSLSVKEENMDLVHVPGAYELGPCALLTANTKKYDAVTCLGCIIRGATPHFEYISGQSARLISQASYDSGIPIIFGVLTTNTIEQAIERAGTKAGNKGHEAAMTAVEMANLYRIIQKHQKSTPPPK